jgi:predicted transcriptional regulator
MNNTVYNACTPSLSDAEREVLSVLSGYDVEDVDELASLLCEETSTTEELLEGLMFDGYVREGTSSLELTEKGEVAFYGLGAWGQM